MPSAARRPPPAVTLALAVAAALGLVLLVAAALRVPHLQAIPHLTDETGEVLWAHDIAFAGARPLTHTDAYNGPIWPYLLAAALWSFGSSATLPRAFALLLGLATIAATFALGWQLARREARLGSATLAGMALATAFTHALVNSRVAWSNNSTPLWTTLTAIALLSAVRRRSAARLLVAGMLGGLALQSHPSVSVFLCGCGLWFLLDRERRAWLRRPAPWLAILALALAYSPVLIHNLIHNFATLAEAQASRNFATDSGVPWSSGVVGLLAQLGRSLGGGFGLDGVDPAWAPASWLYTGLAAAALLALVRGRTGLVGRRLPLTVVAVAVLALPFFNANWHGLLEARYLGFTWPLIAAASGTVIVEGWHGVRRAWKPVLALGVAVLLLAPVIRLWEFQADALFQRYDNRRLWSVLRSIQADPTPGEVQVDAALKTTAWRAGGHPRRAVEYLLTMEAIPWDRTSPGAMAARLAEGGPYWLVLAGPSEHLLANQAHPLPVITFGGRREERWGLYRAAGRSAESEEPDPSPPGPGRGADSGYP